MKNHSKSATWQPSAPLPHLRERAKVFNRIRHFFADKKVLEVDTPLLGHASVTDPFIQSIPALLNTSARYYLQTSPEYAMKRLLAAGSGDIFQMSKAFRQDEIGRLHNPEFMLLEWYRLGFTHHDLMDEVDELLQLILNNSAAERKSYEEIFIEHVKLNPHHADVGELIQIAHHHHISVAKEITNKDTWLQLLMSEYIEPRIGHDKPCFIYDFPASQAALARIQQGPTPLAARFEVYYQGIELANGFHELQDVNEQRLRFQKNKTLREQLGLEEMLIDELFLSALSAGLPDCAGVALGIDRLMMLVTQSHHIADILSFDITRA